MNLHDDMKQKMGEYERLARRIAKQMGHDPDVLICLGEPERISLPGSFAHVVNIGAARPLWTAYLPVAREALGVELKG